MLSQLVPWSRDRTLTSTFLLLDGIDGRGYQTACYKPRLDSLCSLSSWTWCVSRGYFENVITISLQLGIRRVNSRFEAYKLNFHNPSEGLPNCGIYSSPWAFECPPRSCFFVDSVLMDGYYFRIKKDVSSCWGSLLTSSSMRGAKCLGNIYLLIYLFKLLMSYYLNTLWPFGLTLTFGQGAFSEFLNLLAWPIS